MPSEGRRRAWLTVLTITRIYFLCVHYMIVLMIVLILVHKHGHFCHWWSIILHNSNPSRSNVLPYCHRLGIMLQSDLHPFTLDARGLQSNPYLCQQVREPQGPGHQHGVHHWAQFHQECCRQYDNPFQVQFAELWWIKMVRIKMFLKLFKFSFEVAKLFLERNKVGGEKFVSL